MISLIQLKHIIPFAGSRAATYLEPLNAAMEEFSIVTPARAAMWLANLAHESGSLRYTREIASGVAYDQRKDLGNTKRDAIRIAAMHGLTPGQMWRGRGLIQITGYNNYRACSQDLYGRDNAEHLLHHPEILELPGAAARSAGWYWWHAHCNPVADAGDFDGVCDIINRGRKTQAVGDANGFDDRLSFYERAKLVLK